MATFAVSSDLMRDWTWSRATRCGDEAAGTETDAAGAIPATNVSAAGTAVGYGAYAAGSSPSAATCGSAPGGKTTSDSSGVIGSISGVSIEAPLAAIGAAAGPIGSDIGYAAADSV